MTVDSHADPHNYNLHHRHAIHGTPYTSNATNTKVKRTNVPKQQQPQSTSFSPAAVATVTSTTAMSLWTEFWLSTELLFQSRLTWLLLLGPIAVMGDATGLVGEAMCFAFAGMALIPCAERLSFITEQVAEHTNGTIGALLNATFGNAPELLISTFALRSGYYRVVQLAMLGSMLTNMMLVFGLSCLIGGLRWQVQELRLTSGNVSVVMLLVATAGCLLPAALVLTEQFASQRTQEPGVPTQEEVTMCRINAAIMLSLYVAYLVFQLGTHKEEFDDDFTASQRHAKKAARRNLFCIKYAKQAQCALARRPVTPHVDLRKMDSDRNLNTNDEDSDSHSTAEAGTGTSRMPPFAEESDPHRRASLGAHDDDKDDDDSDVDEEAALLLVKKNEEEIDATPQMLRRKIKGSTTAGITTTKQKTTALPIPMNTIRTKSKSSDSGLPDVDDTHDIHTNNNHRNQHHHHHVVEMDMEDDAIEIDDGPLISMRIGILWLFIITVCISAMSDILVNTIDGFAVRMKLSAVFTSMVIIPFFSNVAEQVSAFIFAYKNEMDLCVGVTIGSAIQIATFVLPGSVLIGYFMDRSMTLYFHGYETVVLFFCVMVVASVLQTGTTNWFVGMMLVGIYLMTATGIWFHELETLTVDAEVTYAANAALNDTIPT